VSLRPKKKSSFCPELYGGGGGGVGLNVRDRVQTPPFPMSTPNPQGPEGSSVKGVERELKPFLRASLTPSKMVAGAGDPEQATQKGGK